MNRAISLLSLVFLAFGPLGCGDDQGPVDAEVPPDCNCLGSDAAPDASDASDAGEPGATCRDSSVCANGELCRGPNDVACGIPPLEECQTSASCPADTVCHAIANSCSPDGTGSQCGPPCTMDESCGDGFRCGDNGACLPIACDQGFQCRPSESCDPSSIDPNRPVPAITHGCVTIACQGDDDGPCPGDTVCVNGYCQDGPGMCSPPVP